jgi:voltage-gated potassium channel
MNIKTHGGATRIRQRLLALWPQGPLAVVLALVGLLNLVDGLNLPLRVLQQSRALNGLAESLSALGGTAQILLGLMLVLVATGLLWRLVSAWTLSVLLLVITVGVNLAKENWGLSLALQGILLGGLVWAKPYFKRRTILASVVFSLSGVLAVLAYGVFGTYLLRDDFQPPIQTGDWTAAFYYTIVTLSTVGYGDIVPHTAAARWFAMSLLVFGLGVFASAIASALGPKISGELQRMFNPKDKAMQLKDHVILVGEGSIALNTATELKERGVPFVQIVAAKTGLDASVADSQMIEGDATSDAVLRAAGIQHARMVIAARDDDGENAFIALGAKDLNPNVRVMAVASSALSIRRLKLARADLVFSPAAVGSRLLADLVEGNQISPAFQDLLEGHPKKAESADGAK